MDYSNGKIYKIVNTVSDKTYYGSTTQPLHKRFYYHKRSTKRYTSALEIINEDPKGAEIVLVELYPCNSKIELHSRERYYIERNDCVNMRIPTRTLKEYYEDNKERLKDYYNNYYKEKKQEVQAKHKQYYEQNKHLINAKIPCECGGTYTRARKATHFKTQRHKKYEMNKNS